MALTIYGTAASRAMRTLWAAEELGLPYEHVKLGFTGTELKTPEFLKINPNGMVPAIRDGDVTMFESLAINLHLARQYGAGALGAATPAEDAHILQWTFWGATELEPHVRQWFAHTVYLPEADRKPERVAEALEGLKPKFAIADSVLADREYFVAGRFTVADLNLAVILSRLADLGGAGWPHLAAWHARCMSRPAAVKALAMRAAALAG